MSEIPVSISSRMLEPHVPEKNSVEHKGNKIFHALKKSTRESKIARQGERSERSLDLRAKRAEIYKEVVETTSQTRRVELLKEAKARDEIEAQYLSQGEIKVELGGLGEQSARFTMIEPPEGNKLSDRQDPIFLIPGISNDLDSVGSLAKEIAYQGREVILVGMPDSQMGYVTKEFAEATKNSQTVEPHSRFFKAAIDELAGKDALVELWGMSAGSMIVAEILNDPFYQERVKNAVLLSPAGTSQQSSRTQNFGVAKEALRVFKRPEKGAHYSLTMSRNGDQIQKTDEEKALAQATFNAIREKTLNKFEPYNTMRVADGGQITVVSGKKDDMTRSREGDENFTKHPQARLISLSEGVHNTPIIEAPMVVPEIFKIQEISTIRSELT